MKSGPYRHRPKQEWTINLGAPLIALVAVIVAVVLAAVVIWAFLALVKQVDENERECIRRNGAEYCREVMP